MQARRIILSQGFLSYYVYIRLASAHIRTKQGLEEVRDHSLMVVRRHVQRIMHKNHNILAQHLTQRDTSQSFAMFQGYASDTRSDDLTLLTSSRANGKVSTLEGFSQDALNCKGENPVSGLDDYG